MKNDPTPTRDEAALYWMQACRTIVCQTLRVLEENSGADHHTGGTCCGKHFMEIAKRIQGNRPELSMSAAELFEGVIRWSHETLLAHAAGKEEV